MARNFNKRIEVLTSRSNDNREGFLKVVNVRLDKSLAYSLD